MSSFVKVELLDSDGSDVEEVLVDESLGSKTHGRNQRHKIFTENRRRSANQPSTNRARLSSYQAQEMILALKDESKDQNEILEQRLAEERELERERWQQAEAAMRGHERQLHKARKAREQAERRRIELEMMERERLEREMRAAQLREERERAESILLQRERKEKEELQRKLEEAEAEKERLRKEKEEEQQLRLTAEMKTQSVVSPKRQGTISNSVSKSEKEEAIKRAEEMNRILMEKIALQKMKNELKKEKKEIERMKSFGSEMSMSFVDDDESLSFTGEKKVHAPPTESGGSGGSHNVRRASSEKPAPLDRSNSEGSLKSSGSVISTSSSKRSKTPSSKHSTHRRNRTDTAPSRASSNDSSHSRKSKSASRRGTSVSRRKKMRKKKKKGDSSGADGHFSSGVLSAGTSEAGSIIGEGDEEEEESDEGDAPPLPPGAPGQQVTAQVLEQILNENKIYENSLKSEPYIAFVKDTSTDLAIAAGVKSREARKRALWNEIFNVRQLANIIPESTHAGVKRIVKEYEEYVDALFAFIKGDDFNQIPSPTSSLDAASKLCLRGAQLIRFMCHRGGLIKAMDPEPITLLVEAVQHSQKLLCSLMVTEDDLYRVCVGLLNGDEVTDAIFRDITSIFFEMSSRILLFGIAGIPDLDDAVKACKDKESRWIEEVAVETALLGEGESTAEAVNRAKNHANYNRLAQALLDAPEANEEDKEKVFVSMTQIRNFHLLVRMAYRLHYKRALRKGKVRQKGDEAPNAKANAKAEPQTTPADGEAQGCCILM